ARLLRLLPGVHAHVWVALVAGRDRHRPGRARQREGGRMTRDRSLETSVLVQDILVVLVAMLVSRVAHGALVAVVPTLKPPVAAGEYAHLLLVFLPTWIFAADRLGIHRLHTITGEKLEIIRRVILTQAWGVASIGLIL